MALWGNKDNVGSGSTVTLDYDNKVVSGWAGTATGTGTTFGQIGAAKTGDIISFGEHGSTFYGEAVIASIGSTGSSRGSGCSNVISSSLVISSSSRSSSSSSSSSSGTSNRGDDGGSSKR